MNEFEWRRQLRDLRQDVEPPARVWSGVLSSIASDSAVPVAAAVGIAAQRRRHAYRFAGWSALAAAVVVTITLALMSVSPQFAPVREAREQTPESRAASSPAVADESTLADALARNPVLAATDVELRELEEQLRRSLASEPESARLKRMLLRTEGERRRLLQYQSQLG